MFGLVTSFLSGALGIATTITNTLSPILSEIVGSLLTKLANALMEFFKELGLITPDEETIELGDKALQAEMDEEHPLKPEDFNLYSEYIEAVKKYTPDPELSSQISLEDKERKGMEIEAGLAIEKYGEPMLDVLIFVSQHPERFADGQWLLGLGKAIRDDSTILTSIANYITNKNQSVKDDDRAFDAMVSIEKEIYPDASNSAIWESIKQRTAE